MRIEDRIPGIRYDGVRRLAVLAGMPITVFDLETTTLRGRRNFGITEVAMASVYPNGSSALTAELINPQNLIDPAVVQLTGITQAMVRNQPTWGQRFVGFFNEIAANRIVSGFNCAAFDCHAVTDMNAKYGVKDTRFLRILDTMHVNTKLGNPKGKLVAVAKHHGILPRGSAHRALADTILTLELLNALVVAHGEAAVLACMKINKAT